jgi:hypothetical protein
VAGEKISNEVKQFISVHIQSAAELEILLLLHSERTRGWTAADVAGKLAISTEWAADQLSDLNKRGLLSVNSEFKYKFDPRKVEINSLVDQLAVNYAKSRVSVISLIFSKPSGKIRILADAFKLRADDDDG